MKSKTISDNNKCIKLLKNIREASGIVFGTNFKTAKKKRNLVSS